MHIHGKKATEFPKKPTCVVTTTLGELVSTCRAHQGENPCAGHSGLEPGGVGASRGGGRGGRAGSGSRWDSLPVAAVPLKGGIPPWDSSKVWRTVST